MPQFHASYPFSLSRGFESIDPESGQVVFAESDSGNVVRIHMPGITNLTLTVGAAQALAAMIDQASFPDAEVFASC